MVSTLKSYQILFLFFICAIIGLSPTRANLAIAAQYIPVSEDNWYFYVNGVELENKYSGTVKFTVLPHNDSWLQLQTEYNRSESIVIKNTYLEINSTTEWNPENGKIYNTILWIPVTLKSGDKFDVWDRYELFTVTTYPDGFFLYAETEARNTSLYYDHTGKLNRIVENAFFDRAEWSLEPNGGGQDTQKIPGLPLGILVCSIVLVAYFLSRKLRNKQSGVRVISARKNSIIFVLALIIGSSGMIFPFFIKPDMTPDNVPSFQDSVSIGQGNVQTVQGQLSQDTIWTGEIHVVGTVVVPKGVTLTIEPGTVVKFKHYRGYKYPVKVYLIVSGGTVNAIGTSQAQIWFTSDAQYPINGDWGSITCRNTNTSLFKYVIVEFGELGIIQFDSKVNVSYSIIRWCNSEGLYAERSSPFYGWNLLYNNSYHDIALEQFNYDVTIQSNIFLGGFFSIHTEKSNVSIIDNYFTDYLHYALTGSGDSIISIINNSFSNYPHIDPWSFGSTVNATFQGNTLNPGWVPLLPFPNSKKHVLPYMPGSTADQYQYIYDKVDLTREVETRIGKDLSFGWTLEYINGSLWRFKIGAAGLGKYIDLVKLNPVTQSKTFYKNDYLMNPRGLTYDGEFFWVNDFSLLKIFKFKINASNAIEIYASFDIPYKSKGGTMGMTTDGQFLYLISRDRKTLYKINKTGSLVGEINAKTWSLGNSIVWANGYFWSTGINTLKKWTIDGNCVGMIFPPAKDAWAITWEGEILWTLQRTCENWNDDKIFMIIILDDSLSNFYGHFYLISTGNG